MVTKWKDPYTVLGVNPGASKAAVKGAFRQRSLESHPDLNRDDPEAAERAFMAIRQVLPSTNREPSLSSPAQSTSTTPESGALCSLPHYSALGCGPTVRAVCALLHTIP